MPLKKSFSEHSKVSKRSQWQRSHSLQHNNQYPSKNRAPISEVTKKKLHKFQFQEPAESNHPPLQANAASVPAVICIDDDSDKENGATAAVQPPKEIITPPPNVTTPVARLAWNDLMSMGETPGPKDDAETSPSAARLEWHTSHDPISAAVKPMLSSKARGQKRARSSSPTCSPGQPKGAVPGGDAKTPQQALNSAAADLVSDIWDQPFHNSSVARTPLGINNPQLAHLMISSSPRPNKNVAPGRVDSVMRRTISCGPQWTKRRKVEWDAADSPLGRPFHAESTESKKCMVSALVETVNGEISKSGGIKPRQQPDEVSPMAREPAAKVGGAPKSSPRKGPSPRKGNSGSDQVPEADVFSDYGDDDFDDDTLMELDASLLVKKTENEVVAEDAPIFETVTVEERVPRQDAAPDDEFGDLDDDLFAAAEDLIVQAESRTASQSLPPAQAAMAAPESGKQEGIGIAAADQFSDEFGDDFGDDFDFDAVEAAATQSVRAAASVPSLPLTSTQKSSKKPKVIQRYLVTNVLESHHCDARGREMPEKLLVIEADKSKTIRMVNLREDWIDTQVSPKSYVHIIGDFDAEGFCTIDNSHNMIILHPDQLISSTVLADSFSCLRRAVLQDRVKATGESSPAMVYGTLLHEIFQEALMANRWTPAFLREVVDRAIEKHIEDLYTIKVSLNDAREHLVSKSKELHYWAEMFVSSQPRPGAFAQGKNGQKVNMCVSKLLDVEEHVWSPMYGLKGNIDATVQVTMQDGKTSQTLTVPFELKTGKNVVSNHQAQTVLYNLLLSDRYDLEIVYGILFYMESSQMIRVPAIRHELRHMIIQRNKLACYIRERSVQLPPMLKNKNVCGKCYAQTSCFTYHKLADDGDGQTSGMGDKFENLVAHLSLSHKDFFLKWEDLLTKEEKESQKLRRELWTMTSAEREKAGRCFGNVVIEEGSASEDQSTSKINKFHYHFIKDSAVAGFSFMDSQLTVGEPIVVSDEQGHFALAIGYVTSVRKHKIGVAVDRRLHNARIRQPGFDEVNNQVFASIMEAGPEGDKPKQPQVDAPPVRYRLDKDEFSNGMATVRNNLAQVMADGPFGSREIRKLVVDLAPPRFKTVPTQYTITDRESLNVDQKAAIEKVMSAQDYALVLGMPGTGKTTTIAHIIRALVSQGKSVLLTSYTHTAVDNILLKLKSDKMDILRLGTPAKVHPEVQEFAILAAQPKSTYDEIRSAWLDTPIVATTCLGIGHPVFNERTFDYCIVDEASQITLPVCLGPIRMARTFVLVGDHNQLPPLVQNEEAKKGGLDVSLFKLLSDTHPDSVVNLEHQYRMCEDIMTLSNTLIYHGRLKCGTESLRSRALHIPDISALRRHHHDAASFARCATTTPRSFCTGAPACWLRRLIDPSTRVAFVNTDALPSSREEAKGNRIVNPTEARLVAQLVEGLLTAGVPASEIGVMTHYRSQLSLLRHQLSRSSSASSPTSSAAAAIEMHTADRFQGRDKEVVVLSLVRSNEARNIGDLLRDWRRINVALTRAKTKMLVVGSRDTMRGCGESEMMSRFVALAEERGWVYDLPADALERHLFEERGTTQGTAPVAPVVDLTSSPVKAAGIVSSQKALSQKGRKSPKKRLVGGGKENAPPSSGPRKIRPSAKALAKGKPVIRDILNDMGMNLDDQ